MREGGIMEIKSYAIIALAVLIGIFSIIPFGEKMEFRVRSAWLKAALMIANSDQYVDVSIDEYMYSMGKNDGLIMTMKATDDKWSFIKYNENGFVTIVREKEVISDEATVGIYNFARGAEFVKYAHDMIEKNIKVNNEFYVAPVYNMMIEDKKKIGFYNVGKVDNGMYGLGTPSDLKRFLEIYASLNEMRT